METGSSPVLSEPQNPPRHVHKLTLGQRTDWCLTLGDDCLSFTSFSLSLSDSASSILSSTDSALSIGVQGSLSPVPIGNGLVTALGGRGLLWWMVLKVMEAERQYSSKPYKYLKTRSTWSTQQGLMGNESSKKCIETF